MPLIEKKKEVVVEFTRKELMDIKHPFLYETTIINKLKESGIPVDGTFVFNGVKKGTLTQEENAEKKIYIFRWKS